MSILQPTPTTPVAVAERKANQLKVTTARSARRLIREWERSIDTLWDSDDPQAILDALGTDAAEVFELSTAIIGLMSTALPDRLPDDWARIQTKIAKIQPHTINGDGTVTID